MSDAAATGVSKTISRFEPIAGRSLDDCERHYVEVHVPFAQGELRDMEGLRCYHMNRALRQADIAGGWRQRPLAWRFVILRFEPGSQLSFSPPVAATVAHDHTNFLQGLRPCMVDESIVIDRRVDTLALAKYVVELDRRAEADRDDAMAAVDGLAERIADELGGAFGARLAIVNRVRSEAETASITQPGQRTTGRLLDDSTKCAYVELYFDHERYGDDLVASLVPALDRRIFAVANVLHVEERCGVDRRPGPT
jgi:hypothetical protein